MTPFSREGGMLGPKDYEQKHGPSSLQYGSAHADLSWNGMGAPSLLTDGAMHGASHGWRSKPDLCLSDLDDANPNSWRGSHSIVDQSPDGEESHIAAAETSHLTGSSDEMEQDHASTVSNTFSHRDRPERPNPNSNHDIASFMCAWRNDLEYGIAPSPINANVLGIRDAPRPMLVTGADVACHGLDMLGIHWPSYGTTPEIVAGVRTRYHRHPTVQLHPPAASARDLPNTEQFFRFQHTNTQHRPWIEHFELRNLVAVTSGHDIHYASRTKVMSTNGITECCSMDLKSTRSSTCAAMDFNITALAASEDLVVVGGFKGEYALRDLTSELGTEPATGYISNNPLAITNHIHTTTNRLSGRHQAVFCSNDQSVTVLDCNSGRLFSRTRYSETINCAATSPNGRLRVLVGDLEGASIADADTGRTLMRIDGGSKGPAFACAWADDDIHVATAGQDCQVLVWDARNWTAPLTAVATQSTHCTSLRFSPVGGGSPLLIAAQAADVVDVIEARMYASLQRIEFFGDVAGTAVSEDGAKLVVANGDRYFGGLMTFERWDYGGFASSIDGDASGGSRGKVDWLSEREMRFHPAVRLSAKARRRRDLDWGDLWMW